MYEIPPNEADLLHRLLRFPYGGLNAAKFSHSPRAINLAGAQLPTGHSPFQVLQQTQDKEYLKSCVYLSWSLTRQARIPDVWAISAWLTRLRQPLEDAFYVLLTKGAHRRGSNIALYGGEHE